MLARQSFAPEGQGSQGRKLLMAAMATRHLLPIIRMSEVHYLERNDGFGRDRTHSSAFQNDRVWVDNCRQCMKGGKAALGLTWSHRNNGKSARWQWRQNLREAA